MHIAKLKPVPRIIKPMLIFVAHQVEETLQQLIGHTMLKQEAYGILNMTWL